MIPSILNTQGGPRRNSEAQIVDIKGEAIPHLYSAGEFGGITAKDYQGGYNVAECVIFGRIAGINAAKEKEALPEIKALPVSSNIRFTLGSGSSEDVLPREYTLSDNEYIGTSVNGIGGALDVKLTMNGEKMEKIEIIYQHETKGICEKAFDLLPGRMIEAQSVEVDNVASATITCRAIREAVLDAMAKVK